jgi:hypothetical protein
VEEQAGVAQDLELLADFGPDISIIWMKLLQFTVVSINVVVGEFICRRRREESQTFRLTGGF